MTTTTPLSVRLVRASEHAAVGALTLAAFDEVSAMAPDYRGHLADVAGRLGPNTEVLIAVDVDERVLGSVTFVDAGSPHFENAFAGDCGFRMLAVDPDAQGSGAGAALVCACVERGRELGRRRLAINSMATMTTAHALYLRLGFERRPDRDVTFPSGPGVAFQRDLAPDAAAHFPPPGPVPDELPWFEDFWAGEAEAARVAARVAASRHA